MTAEPNETLACEKAPQAAPMRDDPSGIKLESCGVAWNLARLGLARVVNDQRDTVYEDIELQGDVSMKDVKHTAWVMLAANYEIEPTEAIRVIEGFDRKALIEAVLESILIHRHDIASRTYTNWARSALLANNIDPAKLAPSDAPHVLRQLVKTGRAVPVEEFTAAGAHVTMKADLLREV